ncbi:sporulation integral membrane protein YlbJ [Desulfuribacillus stibiiarsenatis]|uniref:Sporulation integral membrane protein YlbJ n=1 Tax=Desulfuribacillus stibiiarsenatis TaxID=1390249 RepID=A0A1E5L709_9FIRM|nr:sporulation integral membrane protein YlbJ [Desulfuribacillus stibiiarsenatis]OEH85769.1 sporulation integral membrane protein YlbJ [Desulfuribacillus stibiiarsenatis]
MHYYISNKSYWKTAILGLLAFCFGISLIIFSDVAFQASLRGLSTWWEVVFPALLPFFIVSEILMGLGVVHFMSVLLEPFMRPIFNVPGAGAFVMTMGFSSGYPIGAKLTTRLREQGLLSRAEGERLVSFTTTSDPLFMFGAISVGFFYNPSIGIIIVTAHYISAILVGIIMRFHDREQIPSSKGSSTNDALLFRALQSMHRARMVDRRPLGRLLGDAVTSSLHTLGLIGGFMIVMSVLISILKEVHVTSLLSTMLQGIIIFVGISPELSTSLITGFFEVTLGSQEASLTNTLFIQKIVVVSILLAWNGLSVHAQVAALLSTSDIRYKPYVISRIIHASLAAITTLLLWEPMGKIISTHVIPTALFHYPMQAYRVIDYWIYMGMLIFGMLVFLFLVSMLIHLFKNVRSSK